MKEACFLQAEDGIRDYKVTGVQTCALPISTGASACSRSATRSVADSIPTERRMRFAGVANGASAVEACVIRVGTSMRLRSEERRVGKGRGARGGAVRSETGVARGGSGRAGP